MVKWSASQWSSGKLNGLISSFFLFPVKLWKQVIKLSASDHELLAMLFAYLEAKQDLNSICIAIDLHVTNRNYTKAIQLFEKYSKVSFLPLIKDLTPDFLTQLFFL